MSKALKFSIGINLILIIMIGFLFGNLISYYNENTRLENNVVKLTNKINMLQKQLSYYSSVTSFLFNSSQKNGSLYAYGKIKYHAVAVAENQDTYYGVILNFTISIIPGSGRVLVSTEPKVGIDLQTSIQVAKIVAENITGIDLRYSDIILSIEAPSQVDIVDGPSAGAVITATLISLLLNKSMDYSIYVTGTINPDGSIGKVGGILEKSLAAAENGAKVFVVPEGEENVTIYIKVEKEVFPGVYLVTYTPKQVNVQKYLEEKGYNVSVVSVNNINELLNYIWRKD